MIVYIIFSILLIWATGSIYYVYKYRGNLRYNNFTHYFRNGWPYFAPLNCILYIFTKASARKALICNDYHLKPFSILQKNWQIIREEAEKLEQSGIFDSLKQDNMPGSYDLGFYTFFRQGWSKFYLKWYGYQHHSALRLCPHTTALLKNIPEVKGAMFSILPPNSKLKIHSDPHASSLRYHLGLSTPNSNKCYLTVDDKRASWQDGEAFIFDETYPHYVCNESGEKRLILMCDVERPMWAPGRMVNSFYKLFLSISVVPNTKEDKIGLLSKLFSQVTPILKKGKVLKRTNRKKYKMFKYIFHAVIFLILFVFSGFLLQFMVWFSGMVFS